MASLTNRMTNGAMVQCRRGCACAKCSPSASFAFSKRAARPSLRTAVVSAAASPAAEKAATKIAKLLDNNRKWAQAQVKYDPSFFNRLRDQQTPEYLWIGCADSRVPANQIIGLDPGEIFVQRNVGNQASHTDMNCQACLDFSVKALGVKTIIVCGHYKCGAVKAALTLPSKTPGLTNCWITDIREARNQHLNDLKGLSEEKQIEKLCEYNVLRQVFHVCTSPTVQDSWDQGKELNVYGMCYSLDDGILQQLVGPITNNDILASDNQEEFVVKAIAKKASSPMESLMAKLTGKKDEPEPVPVKIEKTEDPITINARILSKKLAEHAAWDKGSA